MTDVSRLDDLARAISTASAKIRNYAIAQAAATQSQEADIVRLRGDLVAVAGRMEELATATNNVVIALDERLDALENAPEPTPQPQPGPAGGKHVSSHHQKNYQPAVMRYGDGDYVLVGTWAGAQAARELSIDVYSYASGVTCRDEFFTGLTAQRAIQAGYALRAANGALCTNGGYGGAIGDIGNAAYQDEWAQTVIARHKADGVQGTFIDDLLQSPHIAVPLPAKYPDVARWRPAMEQFIAAVVPKLKAAGLKVILNTGAFYAGNPGWDNGTSSIDWATTLGKPGDKVMIEHGFQTIDGTNRIRGMGPEWFNNWDGWAKVITAVEKAGLDWVGTAVVPPGDSPEAIYLKASCLLFANRPGSSVMFVVDDWTASPFGPRVSADLGAPKGAAALSGQTWRRDFDRGYVTVNPWTRTAQIVPN